MKKLFAFTVLLLIGGCRHEATHETEQKPPANEVWVTSKQIRDAAITTDVVAPRAIATTMTTTGRIAFADARVSHVFPAVTGRITALYAGLGDFVSAGAPLAAITSPDLASAEADLEKARADLAAAERDYARQKELYDAHAAAQRDFEAAESVYRKAKAEEQRAAQKCRMLHATSPSSDQYIVRSPISGEVVARNATPGMEVQGQYSGGTAPELFTVGNIDAVWALADVYEVDLPRIHRGAPVTVTVVAYPDRTFTGRVDWISGALDPATRTEKVRCVIENANHVLRPEMFATVGIQTDTVPRVAVPRSAVVRLADDMVAFVDRGRTSNGEERFERRRVAIDEANAAQFVPVIAGLAPGERVVSSGALILSGSGS